MSNKLKLGVLTLALPHAKFHSDPSVYLCFARCSPPKTNSFGQNVVSFSHMFNSSLNTILEEIPQNWWAGWQWSAIIVMQNSRE